ncbi:hypothetical protein [Kluyvera georgiana]|uniref:hypothetical protein n=1 Tax=Kluyvera georgiana TaxID=73098 RepID=UPI00321F75DC
MSLVRVQSEEPNLEKPAFEQAFCFSAFSKKSITLQLIVIIYPAAWHHVPTQQHQNIK